MPKLIQVGADVVEFPDSMTDAQIEEVLRQQFAPSQEEDPELARLRNRSALVNQQRTPTKPSVGRSAKAAAIDARLGALEAQLAELPSRDEMTPDQLATEDAIHRQIATLQAERSKLVVGDTGRTVGGAIGGTAGAALGAMTGPAAPVAVPALSAVGGFVGSSIGAMYDRAQVVDLTPEEAEKLAREQMTEDAVIEGAFAFVPLVGGKIGRVALNTPQGRRLVAQIARLKGKPIPDAAKLPESVLADVKRKTDEALVANPGLDPEAARRAAEFEALGIKPTQGQITRDPTQYTRERNLRGVENGGESLAQRFAEQDRQLSQHLDQLAQGAKEAPEAGDDIMKSLRTMDDAERSQIDDAYKTARDNIGRAAPVDHVGFVESAMAKLDADMLTPSLPAAIMNQLRMIADGRVPLNVETLVVFDRRLSEALRANVGDPSAQKAIGIVRDALNEAQIVGSTGQEAKAAFDTARGMARERFKTIEEVPGLKAAIEGDAPDHFVNRFLIGGNVADTTRLVKMLEADPAALSQARAQVADYLRNRAFGANAAGDSGFAQSTFNRSLDTIGDAKLRAIFGDEAANSLRTIGRVAAYIHAQPAGSAVNNSNTAAAVMNLVSTLTFGATGAALAVVKKGLSGWLEQRFAKAALNSKVPESVAQQETNKLLRYVTGSTATVPARAGVRATVGGEEEFAE